MLDAAAAADSFAWRATWPEAADEAAALRLIERLAALGGEAEALTRAAPARAMLRAIGGGSPFLSDLAVREHATLVQVARTGPGPAYDDALARLAALAPTLPRAHINAQLRRAKRAVSLIVGLADIGGVWPLSQVTGAIAGLAEAALRLAVAHLLRTAHDRGELRLPHPDDPARDSGLIVLGMGKLGARELNYSSDIDLVLLYDPDAHPDPDLLGGIFSRLARNLVGMMEARDAEGYVFRTDLRLRPDPAATPPAVALPAAIAYYESLGQNWERAAMTKARPVAGDLAAGAAFLAAIRPFVWRRHLDFAAIADLHAMKRRIDAHRGFAPAPDCPPGATPPIAGRDLKLGPGGIREIEFIAQTLQLVWGGRDPALRAPTTQGALRGLVRARRLERRAAAELCIAYRLLRRTEHRLQMIADRQTHSLPEKAEDLARFAIFMGCGDVAALARLLETHQARVRAHYADVFGTMPEPQGAPPLDLAGRDVPPETEARLRAMGFTNAAGIVATLRGWKAGRIRALRSERARQVLDEMLLPLLAALADQPDPDAAFGRFDAMLGRQPAGVQLLSLMQRNPALLARIAAVLGAAPSLADHLALEPSALEGLLTPPGPEAEAPSAQLARRLLDAARPGGPAALEDVLTIARTFVRAEEFALAVAQMEGAIDVDQAGLARTDLADAALGALLPAVLADHASRYGAVPGGEMAVVALGKAGSREMMAGSDLDLMLLYDHPEEVTQSEGARSLPASQWFIRAAHAFVAALTAPGGRGGPLYAVDVRLRPSGNKGPVAVPLPGFVRYHAHEAWTWERMALTRARVVAGGAAMRARVEAAIALALNRPRDAATVRADAAQMRGRLARDLPPTGPWDVKLRPGGGMEVEFIAQVLQLVHGMRSGGQNTLVALEGLTAAGLLDAAEGQALVRADRLWRTVQSLLRITVGRATAALPAASVAALLGACARVEALPPTVLDLPGLHAIMDRTAGEVRAIFERRVGHVG